MRKLRGEKDHEEVYYYRKYRPCNSGSGYHRSRQEKKVRQLMPVQDNDDKRTSDQPAVDAEEELRKQQAKAQEHQKDETNVQKSGKLLPFLNAKAEHHQSRIDSIDEKIANQTDKIDRNRAKIEALTTKADKLEDTNRMLKVTFGNMPLVKGIIERNEKRIQAIREVKIPKREQKIEQGWQKINALTAKRDKISHKLNRVIALNDTIRSFSIGINKQRREAFSDAMDRLNEATYSCLSDKRKSLVEKKNSIIETYNSPDTSVVDKYKLQAQINDLSERIQTVNDRMEKVCQHDEFYTMQSDDTLDAQMKLTSGKLADMVDNGTASVPDLAEKTLFAALETEELNKSQVTALADKFNHQITAKVEEQLEDDYNMIDGIINNGSKEDIDKAKAELAEGIKSMESLSDNPFVSEEVRASAAEELAKMKSQLELFNMYDEVRVDNWLSDMIESGNAIVTDDGGFKVNPDYYKELPRNDRHVETMTEIQAVEVMSALMAAEVQFSASSKGEDKVGITVSKQDIDALNDTMQKSMVRTVKAPKSQKKEGHYQTVNPDYYKSLPKDQRHTRVEPKDVAREIVRGLQRENISYSAVVRKNDTVAITVSKDNAQAYKQISDNVKGERAVQLVNPDFFKSLPKQERFTRRMPEDQAKAKIAELQNKGIEHSAVIDGEKSAVTVAKKDTRTAFFSRSKMKRDVQSLSGQGKPSPQRQQTPKKRENQGLD